MEILFFDQEKKVSKHCLCAGKGQTNLLWMLRARHQGPNRHKKLTLLVIKKESNSSTMKKKTFFLDQIAIVALTANIV